MFINLASPNKAQYCEGGVGSSGQESWSKTFADCMSRLFQQQASFFSFKETTAVMSCSPAPLYHCLPPPHSPTPSQPYLHILFSALLFCSVGFFLRNSWRNIFGNKTLAERPDLRTVEKLREDTSLRTIRFKWGHVSLGYVIKYAGHQV